MWGSPRARCPSGPGRRRGNARGLAGRSSAASSPSGFTLLKRLIYRGLSSSSFFLCLGFRFSFFFPETSCYIHFFSLNVLFTAVDRRRFSQTFINMILQPLPKRLLLSVHKNLSERSITRSAVEIFTVFCIIRHQVPRSVYR